jgi:hypothetical protein
MNTALEYRTINKEKENKVKQFELCDKVFRSYLECISTYSVEEKKCKDIYTQMDNMPYCNISLELPRK